MQAFIDILTSPELQTGLTGGGTFGLFWVVNELRDVKRRLSRIEKKLNLDE